MLFNVRTAYSLLKSTLSLNQYIERAKKYDYQYIGIADINVLHGVVELYDKAKSAGLTPLIGMTLRHQGIILSENDYDLILYAKNFYGYQILIQLSKAINQNQVIDIWEIIEKGRNHLVAIIPGKDSEIGQLVMKNETSILEQVTKHLMKVFGKANLYMGITAYPYNQKMLDAFRNFAYEKQLTLVMNQLIETLESGDAFSLKILQAIDKNEQLDLTIKNIQGTNYLYPLSELKSMYALAHIPEIIEQSENLAKSLVFDLPLNQQFLPKFPVPDGRSANDYLNELIIKALKEKELDGNQTYFKRANYELSVINEMGFSDYFLIVWEILDYCRKNNIRVGPGRGSAAGSLVSYLLNITLVDPIEYNLLFERFLNPERYNMPDIDVDVPDNQRDKVLKFIENRYHHSQVAQIGTMGTFGAKQAIRDTLRVLGFSTEQLRIWSNAIPRELNITLKQAYLQSAQLNQLVNQTQENQQIFQVATTIEGLPRHISTHAAAVVIHDQPIEQVIPVIERQEQMLLTQLTMYDVERVGLLKLDILGLRNLSLLQDIISSIELNFDQKIEIEHIPFDDAETLSLFRKAETNGVFQFESEGIKQVLKRLEPTTFEEIVAVNALYRPGPMKQIDEFIKRKKGQERITYLHPMLEPILNNTYGIIVYQEQVMQICQQMAGFSLGQADLLRRAIGKKQAEVMEKERQHFIEGAMSNGITEIVAKQVFDYILAFANYGFNKSHAVVYSTLAYQLAYLKTHFPLAFFQAVLNQGRSNLTSFAEYITEAKRSVTILPISINHSISSLIIENGKLRLGFESIKGLRREFIQHILNDRQQLGDYVDFYTFLTRMPKKLLKKDWLEALIKVGAFDELGYNRATLMKNLDNFIKSVEFSGVNVSLFQEIEPKIDWVQDWSNQQIAQYEREILGFSLAPHPLEQFQDQIGRMDDLNDINQWSIRKKVKTLVYIDEIRIIETKKQELMAFISVDTGKSKQSLVVFPNSYQRYQYLIEPHRILLVEGVVDKNQRGEKQLIVNHIEKNNFTKEYKHSSGLDTLFIRLSSIELVKEQYEQLIQLINENPGPCKVIIVNSKKQTWQLDAQYRIGFSKSTINQLKVLFGENNIVFR